MGRRATRGLTSTGYAKNQYPASDGKKMCSLTFSGQVDGRLSIRPSERNAHTALHTEAHLDCDWLGG